MENVAAPNVVELTKRCTKCGETKPLSQFKTRGRARGDRVPRASCKSCDQARIRAWRAKNPELVDAQNKRSAKVGELKALAQAATEYLPTRRICSVCEVEQPITNFSRDKRGPFQKSRRCVTCERAQGKKWKSMNPEKVQEKYRRARDSHDPVLKAERRAAHPTGKRLCSRCKIEKLFADFPLSRADRLGISATCNPCSSEKGLEWRQGNQERSRLVARSGHLLRKYGLTPEAFGALYESQGGKCAICRTELMSGQATHIDHCHDTGRVRGLLCRRCNPGLAMFDEDTDRLAEAIRYLRRSRGDE